MSHRHPHTRAERRHQLARAKARARRTLKLWRPPGTSLDPLEVGLVASTHGAACSCWMCGNPRRYEGTPPVQERRAIPADHTEYK